MISIDIIEAAEFLGPHCNTMQCQGEELLAKEIE